MFENSSISLSESERLYMKSAICISMGGQLDMKKAYHYFKLAAKKENPNAKNALNDERFKDFKQFAL